MTLGSLFAGIGGFDLGFERAGFKTIWQVEQDEFCRRVLARHFPEADRTVTDVRDAGKHNLKWVDCIALGFPCQDISGAGLRAGITGRRSGLWSEAHRIIRALRPRFVTVENVSDLLVRGFGRVVGDLADIGYDCEWDSLRAHDFGASHLRERVFIVAYPRRELRTARLAQERSGSETAWGEVPQEWRTGRFFPELGAETADGIQAGFPPEPRMARMVHGIPKRVDRTTALGNAVVPQIAEWIAQRILTSSASQ